MDLSIINGIFSSKIYDKQEDFNFLIVNLPFIDGDVLCSPYSGVYISQLINPLPVKDRLRGLNVLVASDCPSIRLSVSNAFVSEPLSPILFEFEVDIPNLMLDASWVGGVWCTILGSL